MASRSEPAPGADIEDLRRKLREAGLRSTGARIAVLRLMRDAGRPLSHNEVSAALAALGFDHATIYRNLTDLSEVGLMTRTDLGDHVWRFELRRGDADHKLQHPHFVCLDCGVVSCLPAGAVALKPAAGAPRALRKGSVSVQVQGRCDQCQPTP